MTQEERNLGEKKSSLNPTSSPSLFLGFREGGKKQNSDLTFRAQRKRTHRIFYE